MLIPNAKDESETRPEFAHTPFMLGLYAQVTSHPPLGQVYVVPATTSDVPFVVAIEWSRSASDVPWEVVVCYRPDSAPKNAKWSELSLERIKDTPILLTSHLKDGVESDRLAVYVGQLSTQQVANSSPVCFTVKYRVDPYLPWQRVKQSFGLDDGTLVFQSPLNSAGDLTTYLRIEPEWSLSSLDSEISATKAFQLEIQEPAGHASQNENAARTIRTIGRTNHIRFLALVRISEPWLAPRHGADLFSIEEEAIMCSFLSPAGQVVTILPLNGIDDVYCLLKSNEDGDVMVSCRNDSGKEARLHVIVALAPTLEGSIASAMSVARHFVGDNEDLKALAATVKTSAKCESDNIRLEEWFDGLAYCTYNSLGIELTMDKILYGLESLKIHGINISSLIIDDNWQTLDEEDVRAGLQNFQRTWDQFEANQDFNEEGLKAGIARIRAEHPYIAEIAVWHALLGYWAGLSPRGRVAKEYKTMETDALLFGHTTRKFHVIDPDDAVRFYDDFYAFLANCGISAVKTDVQAMLDCLNSRDVRQKLTRKVQNAWTIAHQKHFGGRAISCMSMLPQILFHSCLLKSLPRVALRNSDDYYPELPTSHALHVFINAHNSLLTQHLNVVVDWDMFQTDHDYSAYHAASRCLSGGPILITDEPNRHNVDLIDQMVATNLQNRSIALRPQRPGRVIGAWNNFAAGHVLHIQASSGEGLHAADFVGLFNTTLTESTLLLPSTGVCERVVKSPHEKLLICSHQHDKILGVADPEDQEFHIYAHFVSRGFDILTVHPVQTLKLENTSISFSILGLMRKYTGAAAVVSSSYHIDAKILRIKMGLKALGVFGVWIEGPIQSESVVMLLNGLEVQSPHLMVVDSPDKSIRNGHGQYIFKADILKAWKDLGLEATKGSYADVDVTIKLAR